MDELHVWFVVASHGLLHLNAVALGICSPHSRHTNLRLCTDSLVFRRAHARLAANNCYRLVFVFVEMPEQHASIFIQKRR